MVLETRIIIVMKDTQSEGAYSHTLNLRVMWRFSLVSSFKSSLACLFGDCWGCCSSSLSLELAPSRLIVSGLVCLADWFLPLCLNDGLLLRLHRSDAFLWFLGCSSIVITSWCCGTLSWALWLACAAILWDGVLCCICADGLPLLWPPVKGAKIGNLQEKV